jgi:hypothetical protein
MPDSWSTVPFRPRAPDLSRARAQLTDQVPPTAAGRWAGGWTSSGEPTSAYPSIFKRYAQGGIAALGLSGPDASAVQGSASQGSVGRVPLPVSFPPATERPTHEEMAARAKDVFERELKGIDNPSRRQLADATVKAYVRSEMMMRSVGDEERRSLSYRLNGRFEQPLCGSGLQEIDAGRTRTALQDLLRDAVHPDALIELDELPREAYDAKRERILEGGRGMPEVHVYRARGAVFVRQDNGPNWSRSYQVSPQWLEDQGLVKKHRSER